MRIVYVTSNLLAALQLRLTRRTDPTAAPVIDVALSL